MESKMQFKIEQVALAPWNAKHAKELLQSMGAGDWAEDHVKATGTVLGRVALNEADLSFEYDLLDGKELEILDYTKGPSWLNGRGSAVSHFGMHCTAAELDEWYRFFASRHIRVVQDVRTLSHTNPMIVGKRLYHYVIFDTRHILGVDLKFIVRLNPDGTKIE